ncbi:Trypsin-1 [Orchesella cincta]|uniref:Trypsin-1 n=1 Tax=Orchesella cincta TaxID=48709 RepID=A0A1D2M6P1_ORCCI|nr:Trypsin-1 [Orchesella cincta]
MRLEFVVLMLALGFFGNIGGYDSVRLRQKIRWELSPKLHGGPVGAIALIQILWEDPVTPTTGHWKNRRRNKCRLSETPYQLRLIIRKPGSVTNCGAVLVAAFNIQFALTAAHCVNGATASPSKMEVIAGLHNLKRNTGSEQTKNPIWVVKHSRYTSGNSANDIAILFFATRFNPTSAVRPIALPRHEYPQPGQVKISGWGSTSIGRPNSQSIYPDILQVLTISTFRQCGMPAGQRRTSCGIDSNGRMYVAGLSSYHLGGCGGGRFPMFYTRVSAYI